MILLSAVCPTPFVGDKVDEARLRRRVGALAERGVGVNMCSYGPGEGGQLRPDEMEFVYRVAVRGARGRVPVTAAGIRATPAAALADAEAACAAGVDVVQLPQLRREPPLPPASQAELERFWDGLLERVPRPCRLSIHPQQAPGLTADPELLRRLMDRHHNLTGVAVSGVGHRYMLRVLEALEGRARVVTTTLDTLLLDLKLGIGGVQCMELNLLAGRVAAIVSAYEAGDAATALGESAQVARLELEAFGTDRFPRTLKRLKALLELLDESGGELRSPYLALPEAQVASLAAVAAAIRAAGF